MGDASREIMKQARRQVPEWTPSQVHEALANQHEAGPEHQEIVLVDVREKHEWNEGHIPGAIHVPRGFLELQIEEAVSDKSKTVLIPEVGEQGQFKLLDSRVLLIGAGGLGSPAAYYLAAAGVGTIGIIDSDVVDESNLQRQILHNTKRIGQYKADSARETIEALNPDVKVITHIERLDETNVARIIADYDVILDGTDNFPTRYLLNDAALIANKPVVHGSVFRFEGQLTVFKPYEGPCYRCLYPEPPPPELAPSCAEAGVLGVLPGIIGLLQATETIKLLLGIGDPLVGRLMTYDGLAGEFSELRLFRDPQCPACGENAHPENLPTYAEFCAVPAR